RVAHAYEAYKPQWSPDAARLAFEWSAGDSYNAFAVVKANGRGRLDVGADGDNSSFPRWSPDGKLIAYMRERATGGPRTPIVWGVNTDGCGQHQLVRGADSPQFSPAWSPDGRRIAFSLGALTTAIDVVNADGTELKTIATSGYGPQWSPDGAEVAYVDGTRNDLFVVDADGSNRHRVAKGLTVGDSSVLFAWKPN